MSLTFSNRVAGVKRKQDNEGSSEMVPPVVSSTKRTKTAAIAFRGSRPPSQSPAPPSVVDSAEASSGYGRIYEPSEADDQVDFS